MAVFTDELCSDTIGTWFENLALICLQIPVTFVMTILGVAVVQRYKVDI